MIITKLVSVGHYLPKNIVTNEDLSLQMETSDEWISSRTGIKQRHLAAENELTSDLATHAVREALGKAGLDPEDLDGIIVATTTPDMIFPAVATTVQANLGIKNECLAFDMNAVCTGFIYALSVADSMIKSGLMRRVAVVGAETMSRILDWNDRTTCVLFGDGAGCFIVEATDNSNDKNDLGIVGSTLHSNGFCNDILKVPGGASLINPEAKLIMNGREVFKIAVSKGTEVTTNLLAKFNMKPEDVDLYIMHQANQRILEAIAQKLGVSMDKVASSIAKHANTSAASIPLAFHDYFAGEIPQNKTIQFTAFGGGMTWGSLLLKT